MLPFLNGYLKQSAMILRCAGGGGTFNGGVTQNFSTSNGNWLYRDASTPLFTSEDATVGTVNGSKALVANAGTNLDPTISNNFLHDTNNDDNGVIISFDFYELGRWNGNMFSINVGNQNFDLGEFHQPSLDDDMQTYANSNSDNTVHWVKTTNTGSGNLDGTGTSFDQKHTYKIFLADEFLEQTSTYYEPWDIDIIGLSLSADSTLVSSLGRAGNHFAIDNFKIKVASDQERGDFYYQNDSTENAIINSAFSALELNSFYASNSVAGLWDEFSGKLGQMLNATNSIATHVGGKKFDDLLDDDSGAGINVLEGFANSAIRTFDSWTQSGNGFDQGFDYWGNRLWDEMENQIVAPDNFWETLQRVTAGITGFASLGAGAAAATGTQIGNTAVAQSGGIVAALATQTDGQFDFIPETTNGFGYLDAVGNLYEALLQGPTTSKNLANSLLTSSSNAYDAYFDYLSNSRLAAHVSAFDRGEALGGVTLRDYDALRDLGFTVQTTYLAPNFGATANTSGTKVVITDGAAELFTDRIEYRFTNSNGTIFDWEFA